MVSTLDDCGSEVTRTGIYIRYRVRVRRAEELENNARVTGGRVMGGRGDEETLK